MREISAHFQAADPGEAVCIFNSQDQLCIGINQGKAAGAGLPAHLHQHIIARWAGDTNFITVVGETRIVPHAMETLWDELTAISVADGRR